MEGLEYIGPHGESYYQTIYIDFSDVAWDISDKEGIMMFDDTILDNYCDRIPDHSREEFKNLIYTRIYDLRKRINRKITRTELVLGKFGTLVSIEGIGGKQS
jgi:hypothetical protein